MIGKIFDIKKFAVHDGPGIRTTVFFKGCPLRCIWCHNPEGISFSDGIQYTQSKCVGCGECSGICKESAHRMINGEHLFDRSRCSFCGECVRACPVEALMHSSWNVTVEELERILLEDKMFYEQSGGGITLSGGECLCQADFCAELLMRMKANNIHCAVDTSGYVNQSEIDKVSEFTDIFLYDIKVFDEAKHIQYTGVSNKIILENIRYIDSLSKEIEVRIPLIPGVNMDDYNINNVGRFLSQLKMVKRVKLLAYNNLAGSKYEAVGIENTMPNAEIPNNEEITKVEKRLLAFGLNVIR